MKYKVNLKEIPKNKHGSYLWAHSIGKKVYFINENNITESFTITGTNSIYVSIDFKGKLYKINNRYIKIGYFPFIPKGKIDAKTGKRIKLKTGYVTVLDVERRKHGNQSINYYFAKCEKCGTIHPYNAYRLNEKHGCPVCLNKKIVKGINSLWDTHPLVASLLVDANDGYKVHGNSTKHTLFFCPTCGKVHSKEIRYVVRYGVICPDCGNSHSSFPERLVRNMFRFLPLEIEPEKRFPWSKIDNSHYYRKYDLYLPKLSAIIEINGDQHYNKTTIFNMTLQEIKKIDLEKKKLAIKNGIKNYIYIDARYSTVKFIKNSMIQNKFIKDLFDKYGIDLNDSVYWNQAYEESKFESEEYDLNKRKMKAKNIMEKINENGLSENQKEALKKVNKALYDLTFGIDAFFNTSNPNNSKLWNYLLYGGGEKTINEILEEASLPPIDFSEKEIIDIPCDIEVYELGEDYDVCYERCYEGLNKITNKIENYLKKFNRFL